ncbi:MAG: DUF6351 family protein [Cellvibrionaceae bacterium]
MFKKAAKWFAVSALVLVSVVVAVGGYYLLDVLPAIHEPPKQIVLKIPASAHSDAQGASPSYQGEHPSKIQRPDDYISYPITLGEHGPKEPLFAGPLTYPLWCGRNRVTDEQPMIDNQDGYGVPIFAEDEDGELTDRVLGYSKDCMHLTRARYYYLNSADQRFYPLDELSKNAHQIDTLERDGRLLDFVVRVETGTINRHFYAMAVLRGVDETLSSPRGDYWNKKLIYQFRGGVGIGKRQGSIKPSDILKRRKDQLRDGFAVVYSSANQTSNHYNMWLAEDTALRVKKQFAGLYGDPIYTVGVGGSGGAIQQFLLAQNNPEILDGLIPLYSYPDMISQTIYVLDCEPLEYYFDVLDQANPRWSSWRQRVAVEGLNASEEITNPFTLMSKAAALLTGDLHRSNFDVNGASECVQSWRGLTPLIHNPTFVHFAKNFSESVRKQVHWTHWEDLAQFYGRDENGYAQSTWDNVGVQYGLEAFVTRKITAEEFLRINRSVGGWVKPAAMESEKLWFLQGDLFPVDLSVWSHQNLSLPGSAEFPARRTEGSVEAIEAAYRSGHVFLGHLTLPILDVRHYLEDELDMHHSSASFMTRSRMLNAQGKADNHVVWVSHKDHNPVVRAFQAMDQWLMAQKTGADKPPAIEDACFDSQGDRIASGRDVWDGQWNDRADGLCMARYPSYKTSREIAGAPIAGDVFKCQRQSVTSAIRSGVYGNLDVWPLLEALEATFPDGVCDYRLADSGRPADLLDPAPMIAEQKASIPAKSRQPKLVEPVTLSRLEGESSASSPSGRSSTSSSSTHLR